MGWEADSVESRIEAEPRERGEGDTCTPDEQESKDEEGEWGGARS
jgi:hypothetical protein